MPTCRSCGEWYTKEKPCQCPKDGQGKWADLEKYEGELGFARGLVCFLAGSTQPPDSTQVSTKTTKTLWMEFFSLPVFLLLLLLLIPVVPIFVLFIIVVFVQQEALPVKAIELGSLGLSLGLFWGLSFLLIMLIYSRRHSIWEHETLRQLEGVRRPSLMGLGLGIPLFCLLLAVSLEAFLVFAQAGPSFLAPATPTATPTATSTTTLLPSPTATRTVVATPTKARAQATASIAPTIDPLPSIVATSTPTPTPEPEAGESKLTSLPLFFLPTLYAVTFTSFVLSFLLVQARKYSDLISAYVPPPIYLDTDRLAEKVLASVKERLQTETLLPGELKKAIAAAGEGAKVIAAVEEGATADEKKNKANAVVEELIAAKEAEKKGTKHKAGGPDVPTKTDYKPEDYLVYTEEVKPVAVDRTGNGGVKLVVSTKEQRVVRADMEGRPVSKERDKTARLTLLTYDRRYDVVADRWGKVLSLKEQGKPKLI